MTKIETLYAGKSVKELFKELSAQEIINEFGKYLGKIVLPDSKIQGGIPGRRLYLDERTADIVLEIIGLWGTEYPKEIILLLSEQEYTLIRNITEKYNLFKYLVEEMKTVQEAMDKKLYNLLNDLLNYNEQQIYGKKVYNGGGFNSFSYKGFINTLSSRSSIENSIFGIVFHFNTLSYTHKTIELGKNLGINEEVLLRLEKANEKTKFLELPKNRKIYSDNNPIFPNYRTVEKIDNEDYVEFKASLEDFTKELNQIISKDYPGLQIQYLESSVKKTEANTSFSFYIEKRVDIHNNYENVCSELINVIKTFNSIEKHYFGFDFMHKDLVKHHQEYAERNQPLFGA